MGIFSDLAANKETWGGSSEKLQTTNQWKANPKQIQPGPGGHYNSTGTGRYGSKGTGTKKEAAIKEGDDDLRTYFNKHYPRPELTRG